jgi:hypothetical protein
MRSVAAGYETAIEASTVKVAEIYDFDLADSTSHYYTTHSEDIVWGAGGNTYLSRPLERGPVGYGLNGEVVTMSMEFHDLAGTIFQNAHKQILDGAVITGKRILWNTQYSVGWELTFFVGRPNAEWDRRGYHLEGKSLFGCKNIMVPRDIYQPACTRQLFDPAICQLSRAAFAYSGTATGGSRTTLIDATRGTVYKINFDAVTGVIAKGETITGGTGAGTGKVIQIVYDTATAGRLWYVQQSGVQFVNDESLAHGAHNVTANGAPAQDTTFHEMGEVEMITGANAGQRRPVLSNSGSTVTLFWPFISAVAAGATYKLYPGCDKRAITCAERFGNDHWWRGFPFTLASQDVLFGPKKEYA